MKITYERELEALIGRVVEVIDPFGATLVKGQLCTTRTFKRGKERGVYYATAENGRQWYLFTVGEVADIAGNVIEVRPGGAA